MGLNRGLVLDLYEEGFKMIILDTRVDSTYRGNIEHAIDLFNSGVCDAIMTIGTDFVCVKYSDPHISELVRKRTSHDIDNAEIRYIITRTDLNGVTTYLGSNYKFVNSCVHAIFFKSRESAQPTMRNLPARCELKCDDECNVMCEDGYTYAIQTYLYRSAACCVLRIYYNMIGLGTDYGILQFIRSQVEAGVLFSRKDRCGKEYIFLDELLLFKGEEITLKSAAGVSYKRVVDLRLLLHDGLIAFDAVSKFVADNPDLDIPQLKYTTKAYGTDLRSFYDLGSVIYFNSEVQSRAIESLGLSSWFD